MSSAQAAQRRSARLADKKQASAPPSFDGLPQLALAAIHDMLLHGSKNEDGFCTQPAKKDAACFRSTCKAFYDVAIIPPIFKLAFHDPPSQQKMDSLALMLAKPVAAHTQLSLQLCMQHSKQPCPNDRAVIGGEANQPWALPLASVAQRVVRLEMPSLYINTTLAAACRALPGLRELVLHVGLLSETGLVCMNEHTDSDEESEDSVPAWLHSSQLEMLTLTVPTGKPPFVFLSWEAEPPLDLEGLPSFKHLVLRGPIVKSGFEDGDTVPFFLPPHAKVTIDPGLGKRKPTRWARSLTVYERFDATPGTAIPDEFEYKKEDEETYQAGISTSRTKVYDEVLKQGPHIDDHGFGLDGFIEGFLCIELLESLMELEGIEGRSSMLQFNFSVRNVAASVIESFREFVENVMAEGGWDCMCDCCL